MKIQRSYGITIFITFILYYLQKMTGKDNNAGHGQREIKFRAWDRNHNKMIYPGSENPMTRGQYTNGDIIDNFEDEDIMQYIGLKDKNDVEIYEGDIIYCSINKAKAIIKYVQGIGQYRFFFYTGGRHDLLGQGKGELGTEMWSWLYPGMKKVAVIGNIHENPDLLTS